MTLRETLKKIWQIELRTDRLVVESGSVRVWTGRETALLLALLCLLAALGPVSAFSAPAWKAALKEQSDPAKLESLGKRGANPRVNRIVYCLHEATTQGTPAAEALDWAFAENGTTGLVAVLTKEIQLLNYAHAVEWGLLTRENLEKLKRGNAPIITKGRYKGEATDVDHIVPISLAPEAGNSLANLELRPSSVNRSKGASVGLREMNYAARLREAGVIDSGTLLAVRWAFVRGSVLSWVALAGVILLAWFGRRSRRKPGGALLHGVLFGLLRGMLRRR